MAEIHTPKRNSSSADVNVGRKNSYWRSLSEYEKFQVQINIIFMGGSAMMAAHILLLNPLSGVVAHSVWLTVVNIVVSVAAFIGGGCLGYSTMKDHKIRS